MDIYIDNIDGFVDIARREVVGVTRYYYAARPPYRVIIVAYGQPLTVFHGHVADASVGWDNGTPGFVLAGDDGKRHSKITLRRILPDATPDATLSQLIARAPRSDRPGGARGPVGRKPVGTPGDKLESHQLTMPASYWRRLAALDQRGKSNWSRALRNMLDDLD